MSTKANKQNCFLFPPLVSSAQLHHSHTFILHIKDTPGWQNPLQILINSPNPPVKFEIILLSFKEETPNQEAKWLTQMDVTGELGNWVGFEIGLGKIHYMF